VPVLSQGESGFIGFHDEEPGVMASPDNLVVTFANHTCAMRLMNQPFSCIQNIFPKIGKKGICDTLYFYYAAQGRVNLSDYKGHHPLFRQAYITIPPLPTQRKIAAILSSYDNLIENNLRRIKILEEMAQNLYREWFIHFRYPGSEPSTRPDGHPSPSGRRDGDEGRAKLVDSPLGRIPEGWECGVVNDLLSLKSGFAFKSSIFTEDGTYGLVTIKNVHDGLFVPDCTSRIAGLPSNMPSFCHLSTGDVLLSLTGNIGRVCLVYGTDYLLNQRVAKLVPNEANNRAYIYFTFRQDEFQTKLSKIANGVAQQNLSPVETGRMQIVLPSQKVLADFGGVCEPIAEQMTVLFRKNSTLRRTRDLLLPRLISGEVDVSELDIAVPEEAEA
jgi:type I restriction enzyme S subunit